jgi:hypothetical protein
MGTHNARDKFPLWLHPSGQWAKKHRAYSKSPFGAVRAGHQGGPGHSQLTTETSPWAAVKSSQVSGKYFRTIWPRPSSTHR